MQFALVVYESKESLAIRNDPKKAPEYWGAYKAYAAALVEAGIARGGAGLEPPESATMVFMKDGKRQVQDGPYADTKEMLAGFFLIEVPDLDSALQWAAKCPGSSYGKMEVRACISPSAWSQVMTLAARDEVENAVRTSYGKLLAILSSRCRDIAACEDALGEALGKALQKWPVDGIPANPTGWILSVARNQIIDQARRNIRLAEILGSLDLENPEVENPKADYPDERIKLLFVCTHPAIDEGIRTPLMLQTVFGMEVADVASAFLISKDAMAKRLLRAKAKIRDACISFEVPEPQEAGERIDSVLESIFAAYGKSWDLYEKDRASDFDDEAIYLARLLTQIFPGEAECWGLLSLLLSCEARKPARMQDGLYVPLDRQNLALWDARKLRESGECLRVAFPLGKIGRFQLEAAIQSAHNNRVFRNMNNWDEIVQLYDGLMHFAPTIGAFLGRCAAIAELHGATHAWALLESQFSEEMRTHLPYWALRAHLAKKLGNYESAEEAYTIAIGLCENASMRHYLNILKNQ